MSIPYKKLNSFSFSFPFVHFVLLQMLSVSLVFQTNQKESQNHIKYTLRKMKCFHPDQVIANSAHIHNSEITEVTTYPNIKICSQPSNREVHTTRTHTHVRSVCLFCFFKIYYYYYYYYYYSKSGLARAWLEPFPQFHHSLPLPLLKETTKDQTEITF